LKPSLPARLTAEFLGTAFLVAAKIGSGIMAPFPALIWIQPWR